MRGAMVGQRLLAAVSVLVSAALFTWPAVGQPAPPRLLVLLVVDQMRADYLTTFERHWERGFRRLVTDGAVFDLTFMYCWPIVELPARR